MSNLNQGAKRFKGSIIITDPCYIFRDDDWEKSEWGDRPDKIGFQTYLVSSTGYGDWSCGTFKEKTDELLGKFCADAGLVGVFLLDEIKSYNPNYDVERETIYAATLIKDFDGEIWIEENREFGNVKIIGRGNINFHTEQTGL